MRITFSIRKSHREVSRLTGAGQTRFIHHLVLFETIIKYGVYESIDCGETILAKFS